MEHRYTERYSSDLKILIYKHKLPIAIGRVRNGSRSGVFIETDFADIGCEQHLFLEILLNRQHDSKLQRIEMNAIVIHKTERGFGAELDFVNVDHAKEFLDVLQKPQITLRSFQEFAMAANS